MQIPPIGDSSPVQPRSEGGIPSKLIAQMAEMVKVFREHLCACEANPSPQNIKKLDAFAYKLETFLTEHKKEIFNQAKKNGWPAHDTGMNDGYKGIYNVCMIGINTILDPEAPGTLKGKLDFTNEQLTQLNWLIATGSNRPL